MFAAKPSSDSPRLNPRVGGATSPIVGTKPLMRYVVGSFDRLAYTPLRRSERRRLADDQGGGGKSGFGNREECRRLRRTPGDNEHGAEKIMEIAKRIGLGRLIRIGAQGGIGGMPILVRERRLLREQDGENDEDAPQAGQHARDSSYFARHSSSPARKMSLGSFLPMKTSTDAFFSALVHGLPMSPPIIMCTPWKTKRGGLPFIQRMPLKRKRSGP